MEIRAAQGEMRRVYLGGLVGNGVSGVLWLMSAGLATWYTTQSAIILLVVGGFFIYPVVSATLRLSGRPAAVSHGNPFRWLAVQTAFVLPVCMLLIAPVALYRYDWFFSAMAILVGAHYLPFATLYGMRSFLVLGAALVASGLVIGLYLPGGFSREGWVAGAVLLVFAVLGYVEHRNAVQQIAAADRHPATRAAGR